MSLVETLRNLRSRMRQAPITRPWLERRYRRRFANQRDRYNAYCGVYPDFATASANVPPAVPKGYDHDDTALQYAHWTDRVFPYDYPAMFWLQQLFKEGCTSVFDLGGSIGIKYYAYRRRLTYPSDLRWTVYDVPAVRRAGVHWAAEHDEHRQLSFSEDHRDADGHDILFASGSLQYLDYRLWEVLSPLHSPPRHVLITMLPLHPERTFYTVQNMGTLCCAYGIVARPEFLAQMKAAGYSVRDAWDQPERHCDIPFYPEHRVDGYSGFLLDRAGA